MSDPQPDLFARPSTPEEKSWLENLLDGAKGWMTAGDIAQTTFGRVNDRDIRQLASESVNIISGQKGYKHIRHSTLEQVNHSANGLESQGKKMIERAIAIRRRAHEIFG